MKRYNRRDFMSRLAVGTAAVATAGGGTAGFTNSVGREEKTDGLKPLVFSPLPLTAIRPEGWLARQLRIQADGLTGHLDEFWPDVKNSQWFSGSAEGWERAPYWLDGALPLAWLLDDQPLKSRLTKYMDHIMDHQRPDGWYGPYVPPKQDKGRTQTYDLWAFFLMNKVLVQYHAIAGDDRALRAVEKCLRAVHTHIDTHPLHRWGKFRWFENLIAIAYLFERTGDPWLLDLARKHQDQGFDYMDFYRQEDVTVPTPRRGRWKWDKHVVNTGMAVKTYPLWARFTGDAEDRKFVYEMLGILDRYHGQATGMFSGDECLSGRNPLQGSELCAVVEYMYSLEHCLSLLGDPMFGDRLEKIAFNALPATFSPDMWAHQYDQQTNQVQCTINPDHMWTTNGPESNLYGLEPNFGCCTSNMHQGWPKFASHLWMQSLDGGLAAVAYAPSRVRFRAKDVPVDVTLETDYPFRDRLVFRIKPERSVKFPLTLRIPAWATRAELRLDGSALPSPRPGTFHRLDRQWDSEAELILRLPMKAQSRRGYNGALSLERGPLVYALRLKEEWTRVNADKPHREEPHADWEVRPKSDWNYGLIIDETFPENSLRFDQHPLGEKPFSPEGAPVRAAVWGRKIPNWGLRHGWADETPPSPVESDEPNERLELVPYGCTNIRITEFPLLKK
jgi:hypothetical protein